MSTYPGNEGHNEENKGFSESESRETLEKLVAELNALSTRERLQENSFLVEKLDQKLGLPFNVLCKEYKIRAISQDPKLILEAVNRCSGLEYNQEKDYVYFKIPGKVNITLTKLPTNDRVTFENLLSQSSVFDKAMNREFDDKYGGTYKISFESKELGNEFKDHIYNQIFKDRPVTYRVEYEDVQKSLLEFSRMNRGPSMGNIGFGEGYNVGMNFYGGSSGNTFNMAYPSMVNYREPYTTNFYVRKADETEPQRGDRRQNQDFTGNPVRREFHPKDKDQVSPTFEAGGSQNNFNQRSIGDDNRRGKGGRRFQRGSRGSHRGQQFESRQFGREREPEPNRVRLGSEHFPALPQDQPDQIKHKYLRHTIEELFRTSGKFSMHKKLEQINDDQIPIVNRIGYLGLELVSTSARPRKDSLTSTGEKGGQGNKSNV